MSKSIFRKIRRAYKLGPKWASTIVTIKAKKAMHILPSIPPTIYVELTNACNLDCAMCDRKSMTRKQGMMEMNLFQKLIDNAVEIRIPAIKLNRFGESLLHPKLIDMIRYTKERGMPWVYFTSNATLLNEENTTEILRSNLDSITFSVDGATPATYEKIRKNAKYNITVENIKRFHKMRGEMGLKKPRIVLNTLLTRETANEILQFFKQWSSIADYINVIPVGRYGNVSDLSAIDRRGLKNEKRPSHHPFDRLMIFWNGDVTVCCGDINGELTIGNILEDRIETLWKNEKMKRLRRMHLARNFDEIPICDNCDGTNRTLFEEMQKARKQVYRQASQIIG